jgi:NAD(P)H-quinone oxidoreductase subunit 5
MAVPMVILIVVTLFTPALLQSLSLLPATFAYINRPLVLLLILSGIMGCSIGATIPLNKTWSRPLQKTQRIAQDLLAYDFYVDRIYHMTVVNGVTLLSKFGAWLDRYIVDGLVNFVGFASIFGSESLKYSATGQSQSYALTIIVSVGLLISLFFYWSL